MSRCLLYLLLCDYLAGCDRIRGFCSTPTQRRTRPWARRLARDAARQEQEPHAERARRGLQGKASSERRWDGLGLARGPAGPRAGEGGGGNGRRGETRAPPGRRRPVGESPGRVTGSEAGLARRGQECDFHQEGEAT